MIKPPCVKNGIQCTKRHVGCHDTCPEYHDFTEAKEAERNQRVKELESEATAIRRSVKLFSASYRRRHK